MRNHRTSREILRAQRRRNAIRKTIYEILTGIFFAGLLIIGILCDTAEATTSETVPEVPQEIQDAAETIGEQYSICPELLEAIAYKESNFNPEAYGGGCIGLMQIAPKWHRERMKRLNVSEDDLTDAYSNMLVAADYLLELFQEWDDPGMVLMIYNGDSNARAYWNDDAELSDYAQTILELSQQLEAEHGK